MSDDRKYRQRGYQDDDRERAPKPAARKPQEPGAPAGARRISQDAPKNINMPGFREVVRCSQCGNPVSSEIGFETRCPRCGNDSHTCSQCVSFDPGSRFECMSAGTVSGTQPASAEQRSRSVRASLRSPIVSALFSPTGLIGHNAMKPRHSRSSGSIRVRRTIRRSSSCSPVVFMKRPQRILVALLLLVVVAQLQHHQFSH